MPRESPAQEHEGRSVLNAKSEPSLCSSTVTQLTLNQIKCKDRLTSKPVSSQSKICIAGSISKCWLTEELKAVTDLFLLRITFDIWQINCTPALLEPSKKNSLWPHRFLYLKLTLMFPVFEFPFSSRRYATVLCKTSPKVANSPPSTVLFTYFWL